MQGLCSIFLWADSCNITTCIHIYSTTNVRRLFNGFKLQWTSPTNETDPFVHDYQYIVKIRGEANFDFRTNGTTFSTYNLTPSTQYNVSICSD